MRFRIPTLLAATFGLALVLAWFATNNVASQKEIRLVSQLSEKHGPVAMINSSTGLICGTGIYGYVRQESRGWLNRLGATISPKTFERVTKLEFNAVGFDDSSLNIVKQFPYIVILVINKSSITETGLASFQHSNPEINVMVNDPNFGKEPDPDDPFGSPN